MASWNKNNRACKTTWSTLRILDQLTKTFKDTGSLKMKDLTFWNQTAGGDLRASVARMLCIQMNNIFINIRRAKYEEGISASKAVEAMTEILSDPDKKVEDLAEVNDNNFEFLGEND